MRSVAMYQVAQIAIDRRLVEWGYKSWSHMQQRFVWRNRNRHQIIGSATKVLPAYSTTYNE